MMAVEGNPRTTLTVLIAVVWVASLAVRVNVPNWPIGASIDSLMVTMCGWWFATKKDKP